MEARNRTRNQSHLLMVVLAGIGCLIFMCYSRRHITDLTIWTFENNSRQQQSSLFRLPQPFCNAECRWRQVQLHRQDTLQNACAAFNETQPSDITNMTEWLRTHKIHLSYLFVSDKHKALYCNVPKVASSNWKRVLSLMNIHDNLNDGPINQSFIEAASRDTHIHSSTANASWRLSHMSSEDVIHRLNTYTSFIVVRTPYSRVLSAFREKFQKKEQKTLWKYWSRRIYIYLNYGALSMRKLPFRQRNVTKALFEHDGYRPTYQDFVKFANAKKIRYIHYGDQHWMPINELCLPCQIRYDIIAKLETMDADASFILKRFGVPELVDAVATTTRHETNSSGRDVQRAYYSTLSPHDVKWFQKRYEKDFKYFAYDMNISSVLET